MNKEQLFPLIFGLVLGILLMFFWQLGARINNQNIRLSQLEQATVANSQAVNEIVGFINSAVGAGNVDFDDPSMIIE
jgi:hypothetical protein